MFDRLLQLPKNHAFFLFGARNTGKSTLLKRVFPQDETLFLDLLDEGLLARLLRQPDALAAMIEALPSRIKYIVIDEIQKAPALLNTVHRLMSKKEHIFIMTGSSARKLKREGVNLLAGRAFVYHLYPLTHTELDDAFQLDDALHWGTLPEIFAMTSDDMRREFLMAYAHTYLKEEIGAEQLVRDLVPFRKFLEVAAQSNGKIINYSNVARDVGVDDKTVKNYFMILEDTLVGYQLDAYHGSFRKRIQSAPKFYFFDTGVVRALARYLSVPLLPSTHAYGDAFETFMINECLRLAQYYRVDYKFSYMRTHDDYEVDLIIERPGKKMMLLEFKSARDIEERQLKRFISICSEFEDAECLCLSQDPYAKKYGSVLVLPWQVGIQRIFDL